MKHIIKYLIFFFCIPSVFLSQTNVKYKTLGEIKAEREIYFEKQLKEYGKKYMEEEGSDYNEYKRWLAIWEPRLGVNGNIEDYIKRISQPRMSNSPGSKT